MKQFRQVLAQSPEDIHWFVLGSGDVNIASKLPSMPFLETMQSVDLKKLRLNFS